MKLVENADFYFNEQGLMTLTAKYLKETGRCCGNGCRHCPFSYINVKDEARRQALIIQQKQNDERI